MSLPNVEQMADNYCAGSQNEEEMIGIEIKAVISGTKQWKKRTLTCLNAQLHTHTL